MPSTEKKTFIQQARALHRDIGFLTAGLTIIFALSGFAQIFRDSDFLQREVQVDVQLEPGLAGDALGRALRAREFRVERTQGTTVYFRGGSYDSANGKTVRTEKDFIFPLNRFSGLHKAPSKYAIHWLTMIYGLLLLFMALSSFFMFKSGSQLHRRGLILAAAGVAIALIAVWLSPA